MKSKNVMTLDRVLSRFGLASRTEAREKILAGQVKVNGCVVRDPDRWTDPRADIVHLGGNRLGRPARLSALLQTQGIITSHGDP